ncbi:MAG: NADAR family protein [Pirellula sp.]|jgi:predicted NAD-dependent protein-ADP-ribosyltransferase YbiA (DUF1768 family)|nr:NADAR family protein [Planctomycetota bacterium]
MIVRLKPNLLLITAPSQEHQETLIPWAKDVDGHAFILQVQDAQTIRLISRGPESDACREPINVTSRSPIREIQLISNFAHTPFELDGVLYGSVEAFWQCLKFQDHDRRLLIAPLFGKEALRAGADACQSHVFKYNGSTIRVGTFDHWQLMKLACKAKFNQHEQAKEALLSTGQRPLTHVTRSDSRTIPGVILADIWMRIRHRLRNPR